MVVVWRNSKDRMENKAQLLSWGLANFTPTELMLNFHSVKGSECDCVGVDRLTSKHSEEQLRLSSLA